eukprot:scaffold32854_cov17-Tisochrysis_lutea.AAC.1
MASPLLLLPPLLLCHSPPAAPTAVAGTAPTAAPTVAEGPAGQPANLQGSGRCCCIRPSATQTVARTPPISCPTPAPQAACERGQYTAVPSAGGLLRLQHPPPPRLQRYCNRWGGAHMVTPLCDPHRQGLATRLVRPVMASPETHHQHHGLLA